MKNKCAGGGSRRPLKFVLLLSVLNFFHLNMAWAAVTDKALDDFVHHRGASHIKVIFLTRAVGGRQIEPPARYDRLKVIRYYHDISKRALLPVFESVQNKKIEGVKILKPFWINASALADVTPEGLKLLAAHPSVTKIYLDRQVKNEKVYRSGLSRGSAANTGIPSPDSQRPREVQDVKAISRAFINIGLDRAIKEFPQITGQGVIVGVEDSGVDAKHPALAGKIGIFYSGKTHNVGTSEDYDRSWGHGTHVCGTIVGGNRTDNFIGVAPQAKLAVAGTVIDGDESIVYDSELDGMQWFLDLEKNPVVAERVKAVNNSWDSEGAPDQELFYRALAAWEASGILPIFSAGNHGVARSISPPHEYPGTFAVGSFDERGAVAPGSSLGPGVYKDKDNKDIDIPKPDISAPGTDILSAKTGGGYHALSGTSMAAAHVAGVAALLLQVDPHLNPQQIKQLLIDGSTRPAGMTKGHWDAGLGYGRLNAYNSLLILKNRGVAHFANAFELLLDSNSEIADREFQNLSLGEVGGEVDQFNSAIDHSRWLNLTDLD